MGKITQQEIAGGLNVITDAEKTAFENKAEYKNGATTFTTGLTHQVTDDFITVDTHVTINPTEEKEGTWIVVSYAGYFIITSDTSESSIDFDWSAVKGG